jgi:glycosyltransferase involved in cell wall biosynthesis
MFFCIYLNFNLIYNISGEQMKKISILALHLGIGGIESCIVKVANLLCDNYDVTIVTTYHLSKTLAYPLDNKVNIVYLTNLKPNRQELNNAIKHFNIIGFFKEIFRSIKILYLKKITMINYLKNSHSDITISSRIYFNNLLGKYGHGIKIGWEHNHHHGNIKYQKQFIKSCQKLDKVILVSQELNLFYQHQFAAANISCKCYYIPNFIEYLPAKINSLTNLKILAVGRLENVKGFTDLITTYNLINKIIPNTSLSIVGDGSQKTSLQQQIKKLNLQNKITLLGNLDSTALSKIYAQNSLYLMTSFTESFGLVLIEAMSYGIPCLAFTSAEGANAIINNGINGYLINKRNKELMAEKVVYLFSHPEKLQAMGEEARKTAEKYQASKVQSKWFDLLEDGL